MPLLTPGEGADRTATTNSLVIMSSLSFRGVVAHLGSSSSCIIRLALAAMSTSYFFSILKRDALTSKAPAADPEGDFLILTEDFFFLFFLLFVAVAPPIPIPAFRIVVVVDGDDVVDDAPPTTKPATGEAFTRSPKLRKITPRIPMISSYIYL